jgi:hypothetical protein
MHPTCRRSRSARSSETNRRTFGTRQHDWPKSAARRSMHSPLRPRRMLGDCFHGQRQPHASAAPAALHPAVACGPIASGDRDSAVCERRPRWSTARRAAWSPRSIGSQRRSADWTHTGCCRRRRSCRSRRCHSRRRCTHSRSNRNYCSRRIRNRLRMAGQPIGHSGCTDRSTAADRCAIRSNTSRRCNRTSHRRTGPSTSDRRQRACRRSHWISSYIRNHRSHTMARSNRRSRNSLPIRNQARSSLRNHTANHSRRVPCSRASACSCRSRSCTNARRTSGRRRSTPHNSRRNLDYCRNHKPVRSSSSPRNRNRLRSRSRRRSSDLARSRRSNSDCRTRRAGRRASSRRVPLRTSSIRRLARTLAEKPSGSLA